MREFIITDAADQEFTVLVAGKRCAFRFRYNTTSDRWTFDLSIQEVSVLVGRRVVLGVDLLAAFDFGIGAVFAVDYEEKGNAPDRASLPARRVRVYQHDGEVPA